MEQWSERTPGDRRLGVRAAFMLLDGSLMDLTLCDACAEKPDLNRLWGQVLAGWRYAKPGDERMLRTVARQADENLILAMLYKQKWKDVEAGLQWQAR